MEIPVFIANSVDPDQTPRRAASDLRLHRLPMSLIWDAKIKWVAGHNAEGIDTSAVHSF